MDEIGGGEERLGLDLLLVPSGGAWFGFDLEQLSAIDQSPGDAGSGEEGEQAPLPFHLLLGHGIKGVEVAETEGRGELQVAEPCEINPGYRLPRIVTVREEQGRGRGSYRLLIEAPEDIKAVDWREIRPLPPLLEPFARRLGVWGVLPMADGRLVLLIDCHAIKRGRRDSDETDHPHCPA